MFRKAKRKRSTVRSWVALVALICMAGVMLLSILLSYQSASVAFATQPWSDPNAVCITPWSLVQSDVGEAQLREAFANAGLPVAEIWAAELGGYCSPNAAGTSFNNYDHASINVYIPVENEILSDVHGMGALLSQALAIIKDVDLNISSPQYDMLRLIFASEDGHHLEWSG